MIFYLTLRSFFRSWSVYLSSASLLLLLGVATHTHVIGERPKLVTVLMSDFLYVCSVLAMIAPVLIAIKVFAEPRMDGREVWYETSPYKVSTVLLQRYSAGLAFLSFLILLSCYFPLYLLLVAGGSWMHLLVGCIGLLSLGAATLGISSFFCSIQAPIWVSALLSLVVMLLLLLMWKFSQWVPESAQGLFAYLSLHDQHFDGFRRGVFKLGSFAYYWGVAALFLLFTFVNHKLRRVLA